MPTQFSQFINGGNPQAGDRVAGLRNNLNTLFDFSGQGGSTLTIPVNQVAHGLTRGQIVRLNGGTFVTAQANNAANAEVVGIVSSVVDVNNFVLQFGGLVINLIAPTPAYAPLTPGTVYYLDPAVAGNAIAVAPVVPGQINKPLMVAYTASSAFWFNYRGQVI